MCTNKDGTIFKTSSGYKKERNSPWRFNAIEGFGNDLKLYKQNDYRCLKQSNETHPENWTYYDMKGYREAKTKDELKHTKG